jgi:hypothetical protein
VLKTLEGLDLDYPKLDPGRRRELALARRRLLKR